MAEKAGVKSTSYDIVKEYAVNVIGTFTKQEALMHCPSLGRDADVVVNVANSGLWAGGGICGKELFDAYYNSLKVMMENGYCSISFSLISSGIFGGALANPVVNI